MIKQHLKIKRFIGYSRNAVMIQIFTALLVYVLTAAIKKMAGSDYSLLKVYRITKAHLFEMVPLLDLLANKPLGSCSPPVPRCR